MKVAASSSTSVHTAISASVPPSKKHLHLGLSSATAKALYTRSHHRTMYNKTARRGLGNSLPFGCLAKFVGVYALTQKMLCLMNNHSAIPCRPCGKSSPCMAVLRNALYFASLFCSATQFCCEDLGSSAKGRRLPFGVLQIEIVLSMSFIQIFIKQFVNMKL